MTDESLFATLLDEPAAAARAARLAACPDPERRQRVAELLAAHDAAGSGFLGRPAVGNEPTQPGPPPDPDATAPGGTGGRAEAADAVLALLRPGTRPGSLGRIGHYELLEILGSGGFGTVFKAFDDRLHRVVAVKVLAPQLAASGAARKRFERESRSAAAVRDDHVVNVHAVSNEGDAVPFLVMEFVAGQTLQAKLDKAGSLPVREVLRIGLQTARGLAAAHATGLIHRDIKPANILLENGVERVKITDFGLARAADDASISQSGVVAGTPMYMSPEQARGDALDTRSDLFSLGSVLYALCTGRPPFRADSALAVLKRVADETPRPVRELNPEVPAWLADVVARLHAKNPADRFQTAAEVADLLGGYLAEYQQQGTVTPQAGVAPVRRAEPAPGWAWWFVVPLVLYAILSAMTPIPGPIPRDETTGHDARFALVYLFGSIVGLMLLVAAIVATESRGWAVRLRATAAAFAVAAGVHGGIGLLAPTGPGPAAITLRLNDPAVQYQVDEVGTHHSGGTVVQLELSPGEHWFWLQHDDRKFRTAKFTVAAGGRHEVAVTVTAAGATAPLAGRPRAVTAIAPNPADGNFDAGAAQYHQHTWSKHLNAPVDVTHAGTGLAFRLIPPGEFQMGYSDADLASHLDALKRLPNTGDYERFAAASSAPRHTVRITRAFYLAKHETTVAQFRQFLAATGRTPTGAIDWKAFVTPGLEDKQPVVGVSWDDAVAFCKWLGTTDGKTYHLPTEAEWEFAARAGSGGLWACGSVPEALVDYAVVGQSTPAPGPVGLKKANSFGLFDVAGGVDEWCRDWHVADFYRRSPLTDPVNLDPPADPNTGRVARGGSWNAAAVFARSAARGFDHPTRPAMPKGFRVARAVEPPAASADGFVALFNGKDLTGWKTHPDQPGGWRVELGQLVSTRAAGYLFTEKGDWQDFHLRAEVHVTQGGNSGVFFRTPFRLDRLGGPDQDVFAPAGWYEADLFWGPVARPGRIKDLGETAETLAEPNQWLTLEVIARGNHFVTKVNGREAVNVVDAKATFARGHVALQSFTPATAVRFRKIEIKELPVPPADGFVPLFNGRDLTGWELPPGGPSEWAVADGVLVGRGATEHAALFTTAEYADFHLRCDGRLNADGNSGLLFRAVPRYFPDPRTDPRWFEAEILNGPLAIRDDSPTGCLIADGVVVARPTRAVGRAGEWVRYEVVAVGNRITLVVDGVTVVEYTAPPGARAGGRIGLQKVWAAAVAEFRNIEVKDLSARRPAAAVLGPLRGLVAAREKGLAEAKARVEAGVLSPHLIHAADADLADARAQLAEAEGDKAGLVTQLQAMVRAARAHRELVALRAEVGQSPAGDLSRADAQLAEARLRLVRAGGTELKD